MLFKPIKRDTTYSVKPKKNSSNYYDAIKSCLSYTKSYLEDENIKTIPEFIFFNNAMSRKSLINILNKLNINTIPFNVKVKILDRYYYKKTQTEIAEDSIYGDIRYINKKHSDIIYLQKYFNINKDKAGDYLKILKDTDIMTAIKDKLKGLE